MTIVQAVFRNGVFEPIQVVDVPEGTPVRLTVETVEPTRACFSRAVEIARRLSSSHPGLDVRATYMNRAELDERS